MPMSMYRVTIAGVTAAAPGDGFIDNMTIEQYMRDGSAAPTTLDQTTAKERANLRYKLLTQQLSLETNIYVSDIVAAGGSASAAPSSFVFTATVEHGDDSLFTRDEANNNAEMTGVDALKRYVARALITSRTTNSDIYDPTKTTAPGNQTMAARAGTRINQITVGKLAANLTAATALVTVAKI